MTRPTRRRDPSGNLVDADALLTGRGEPRLHGLEALESRRDVVQKVGREDLAAHDLVEAAGDLLVHRDPRRGLQDAVRLLVGGLVRVVALQLEPLPEGNRPGADDGSADGHLSPPASVFLRVVRGAGAGSAYTRKP